MNASRQSFIVSAVICALLVALFVARYRLCPYPVEAPFEGGMPLAAALTRFSTAWSWFAAGLAVTVVVWTLLIVVQLTIKYAPAASRNYLPAQVFFIGIGGLAVSGEVLAALLAAWFMALAIRQFVFSLHKGYRFSEVFHAGFYLGCIPLLYAPAAVAVAPVAIAAMVIYRRSVRETVICFAGLALPVPAAGFIHWAFGFEGGFIYRELWRCIGETLATEAFLPYSAAIVAILILALALIALIWVVGHKKSVRKTQYKFICHISFVLLFLAASVVAPGASTTLAAIAAVPCAMSVPHAFQGKIATVSTALYCIIVATVSALALLPVLGISVP